MTLTTVTNSLTAVSDATTFRLQNNDDLELFLSQIFVEEKTPEGWRVVNEIVPSADQVVAPGKFKDLPLQSPAGSNPWRLQVDYGEQLRGTVLFLAKVDFAIHEHRIPRAGFGAFTGSNSLSSMEISR